MKIGGETRTRRPEDTEAAALYDTILDLAHELGSVEQMALFAHFKQRRAWDQASAAVRDLFRTAIQRLRSK